MKLDSMAWVSSAVLGIRPNSCRLLHEGDGVAPHLGDPDGVHVGSLELGDVGREVLGAQRHVQAQGDFFALRLDGLLERLSRITSPDIVSTQGGKGIALDGLGPLLDHGDVHRVRVVGADTACLAAVGGDLVRFGGLHKVGGVPAVQILDDGQRDRRGYGADQQVVAVTGQFFSHTATSIGCAFVISLGHLNLAAIHAACGVGFINGKFDGSNDLTALLGKNAGLGRHQADLDWIFGLRQSGQGQRCHKAQGHKGAVNGFHFEHVESPD
jgi:hypothetical protein